MGAEGFYAMASTQENDHVAFDPPYSKAKACLDGSLATRDNHEHLGMWICLADLSCSMVKRPTNPRKIEPCQLSNHSCGLARILTITPETNGQFGCWAAYSTEPNQLPSRLAHASAKARWETPSSLSLKWVFR